MKINSIFALTLLLLTLGSVSAFAQTDTAEPAPVSTEPALAGNAASTQSKNVFSGLGMFSIELSAGGFGPRGDLRSSGLFENAFAMGINGGITPPKLRQLQFDFGADFAFEGLTGRRTIPVGPGLGIRINDSQIFPYAGARVYLTPRTNKALVSVGGGAALGTYNEYINTGDDYGPSLDCTVCESRWGTGGYAMGQFRYRFENGFGVGLTTKYYSIRTSGYGFSNVLGRRSSDQWLGIMLTFSFN
ncbi:MAG TPA: hypothetical protein PLK30_15640 [Blastocatellia bacterium]|nr:hypothetical protein [Blastocatellia bacterium]